MERAGLLAWNLPPISWILVLWIFSCVLVLSLSPSPSLTYCIQQSCSKDQCCRMQLFALSLSRSPSLPFAWLGSITLIHSHYNDFVLGSLSLPLISSCDESEIE